MKLRKKKYIGVIIHHTATKETTTMDELLKIFKNKGYATYGYNYIIKRNTKTNEASIKEGRSIKYTGAHTYIESQTKANNDKLAKGNRNFYNENFLGIALMGNYETNNINEEYFQNVKKAINHIIKTIELKDNTTIKYILCHRDVDNTACPGKNFYKLYKSK